MNKPTEEQKIALSAILTFAANKARDVGVTPADWGTALIATSFICVDFKSAHEHGETEALIADLIVNYAECAKFAAEFFKKTNS